jgi:hypothetical protein
VFPVFPVFPFEKEGLGWEMGIPYRALPRRVGQTPPAASRTRQASNDGAASAGEGGAMRKLGPQPGQARARPMSGAVP